MLVRPAILELTSLPPPLLRVKCENFYKELLKSTYFIPSCPQKSVGSGEVSSNTADIVQIWFLSLRYASFYSETHRLDYSLSLDILIISKFLIPTYIYKNVSDITQLGSLILSFDSLKYSE